MGAQDIEHAAEGQVPIPDWARDILAVIDSTGDVSKIRSFVVERASIALNEAASYGGPAVRAAGHRLYDALIEKLFTAVLRAASREAVLGMIIGELSRSELGSAAYAYFILDAQPSGSKDGFTYAINIWAGLRDPVWRNFTEHLNTHHATSPFLRELLTGRLTVDLWYAGLISTYAGEFDVLPRAAGRIAKGSGYWITAMPLPSQRSDRPHRAAVALYPNRGSDESPIPAAGASQDLRVLHFLRLAYSVMEHQIDNMAHEVMAERGRLIASLAPGLLHHEIGAHISLIEPNLNNLGRLAKILRGNPGDEEDWQLFEEAVANLNVTARRLATVTHGFNNLEKRRPQELGNLADLLKQVRALCYHRLGKAGVRLDIADDLDLTVVTDPALLLHVFLNIITNAINAFEEATDRPPNTNRMILAKRGIPSGHDSFIAIEILNNGPPIHHERIETIFEKGFTTRRSGHGYGLYICRLITEALEGRLTAETPEPESDWAVCFRLELPNRISHQLDVAAEVRTKSK
ncbi:MAG: sensor histidine kinase [Alphaproteobacteria bacterium]